MTWLLHFAYNYPIMAHGLVGVIIVIIMAVVIQINNHRQQKTLPMKQQLPAMMLIVVIGVVGLSFFDKAVIGQNQLAYQAYKTTTKTVYQSQAPIQNRAHQTRYTFRLLNQPKSAITIDSNQKWTFQSQTKTIITTTYLQKKPWVKRHNLPEIKQLKITAIADTNQVKPTSQTITRTQTLKHYLGKLN